MLGKRVLEDEYGLQVALEGYKAPRQQQAKQIRTLDDGELFVERGSSLEFISTLPKMGLLILYAEDKMLSFLSQMSARLLAGPPTLEKKTTLAELLGQKRKAEVCKLLHDIKLPTIKEPAELGELFDNAYFERNRESMGGCCRAHLQVYSRQSCNTAESQHSYDARLERQVKRFIASGGLTSLRDEFPNECAILESFDKFKSLFV